MVAETEGKIAGSPVCLIAPSLTHQRRPWCIIENVIVDKNFREKGVGRQLMEYAVEEAWKNGCYKVVLTSQHHRKNAHRF